MSLCFPINTCSNFKIFTRKTGFTFIGILVQPIYKIPVAELNLESTEKNTWKTDRKESKLTEECDYKPVYRQDSIIFELNLIAQIAGTLKKDSVMGLNFFSLTGESG